MIFMNWLVLLLLTICASPKDAYQAQLTNGPAEELAKHLLASSKGAFVQCGFVSGGKYTCVDHDPKKKLSHLTFLSHRFRSDGGRYEACSTGN